MSLHCGAWAAGTKSPISQSAVESRITELSGGRMFMANDDVSWKFRGQSQLRAPAKAPTRRPPANAIATEVQGCFRTIRSASSQQPQEAEPMREDSSARRAAESPDSRSTSRVMSDSGGRFGPAGSFSGFMAGSCFAGRMPAPKEGMKSSWSLHRLMHSWGNRLNLSMRFALGAAA